MNSCSKTLTSVFVSQQVPRPGRRMDGVVAPHFEKPRRASLGQASRSRRLCKTCALFSLCFPSRSPGLSLTVSLAFWGRVSACLQTVSGGRVLLRRGSKRKSIRHSCLPRVSRCLPRLRMRILTRLPVTFCSSFSHDFCLRSTHLSSVTSVPASFRSKFPRDLLKLCSKPAEHLLDLSAGARPPGQKR